MKNAFCFILLTTYLIFNQLNAQTVSIIVNEVSQGTGTAEYIELLVTGDPECNNVPCIDIRGWIIDDNDGGTYGTSGVAAGAIRLSQDTYWECVKIGTLIVLYNENSPNSSLPPDDIYDADNDCVHVIPFGPSTPTSLFEAHETMPNSADPTYATIGDAGWITNYDWNIIGMRNGGDVIQIINPTTLVSSHAVAWGDNNSNSIIYVNDESASGNVYFMNNSIDNDPFNALNWTTEGSNPNDETPGSANNNANSSWIASMNYGCGNIDTLDIDSVFVDPNCSICDGSVGVNFLGGISPFTYSWDNGNSLKNITNLCSGSFKVTVMDNNGCKDSTSVSVTSPTIFTATVATIANETCNNNQDGSVSVTTIGTTTTLTYNWNTGNTNKTLTGLAGGVYVVTVTDENDCFEILATTVTAGNILTVVNNTITAQCLNGNDFTFNGTGTTPPNSCGIGCPIYTWEFGDNNNYSGSNNDDLSPSHSYAVAGSYNISLTIFDGTCSEIETITVDVFNEPSVTLTATDITCNGLSNGSISALAPISNYSYNWSNGNNTSQLNNLSTGNYELTLTDSNNCSNTYNYAISEPAPLIANYNASDTLVCEGQSIQLTVIPSGGTSPYPENANDAIVWSDSGIGLEGYGPHTLFPQVGAPEVYSFSIYDSNGCSAYNEVTIQNPTPLILNISDTISLCLGQDTEFCATGTGGSDSTNYQFMWSNGVLESGTSKSCLNIQETGSTTYRVILSDGCSPKDTAYTTVIINQIPSVSFSALNNEGCQSFTTLFTATSSINNSFYEWDMDGDGTADTTGPSVNYTFYDHGIFDVLITATSPEGCTANESIAGYIKVFEAPIAEFILSPQETTFLNPTIKVDGTPTINADSLLFWNFGDGNTGEGILASNSYQIEGTYNVALAAFNFNGCFDSDTQTVIINPAFTVYIPNAFHPTGYNFNAYFHPIGIGIDPDRYEMYIYDRWGHNVFHTKELNTYWDGSIKGTGVIGPAGIYVYKIYTADIATGQYHEFVGHVTLIK